jgi:protein-S-isoprenylcysteine O-methyltransferase Ste14
MMPLPVALLAMIAYASLAIELTVLHVPSIASTAKIWSRPAAVEVAYSPAYRGVFSLSRTRKLLLFVLPLVAIYGVFLYPLVALFLPRDPLGDHVFATTTATDSLAALLVVLGRGVSLGAVISIRRGGGERGSEPLSLRTHGLFRYSRNPGLVGMCSFATGLWVAAPSLTMLCGILIYVVHMDFRVRMEEDYLENKFGEPYRAYREQTRRYWP